MAGGVAVGVRAAGAGDADSLIFPKARSSTVSPKAK